MGRNFKGKQCVVLGSNNSAHDICADLWENDADVTMVQRSSTLVARSETLFGGSGYSEGLAGSRSQYGRGGSTRGPQPPMG